MKKQRIISIFAIILLLMSMINLQGVYATSNVNVASSADYSVDLTKLTYVKAENSSNIKIYELDEINQFIADYNLNELPEIYITKFLFDGVSAVKTYDLDDFIESGNDVEVDTLELTVFNVNTTGDIEFIGEIKGGMIAVNTNGVKGEMNLILNGVNIDTDSKKVPAIYVYNKDITHTGCKVTIKTVDGTKNYIEGGKFKKVSLVGSDELSDYSSKYSGTASTNYQTYTNYYGVYTSSQIDNILFAKVQADNEDLADGDPYYFYKGAGAISSDIDLYFQGDGFLSVISKNKEGIETKGNLTFSGGTGDYYIKAEDDCLNTTSKTSQGASVRNALTIDVNSLTAFVDPGEDADEGDAIDSNGTLTINGGTIIALAHPGQDAGIDSENGTYINGGTVLATGDMFDEISEKSKQNFIALSFNGRVTDNTLLTLVNEDDDVIIAFKGDRTYTNLVYSSPNLKNGTYYLYKGGYIEGKETDGLYTGVTSYTKGTLQGYSSNGMQGGMMGGMKEQKPDGNMGDVPNENQMQKPDGEPGQMPFGNEFEMPEDMKNKMPRQKPNGNDMGQMPNGNMMQIPGGMQGGMMGNASATNKAFTVSGISNMFSGVADYTEADETTSFNNGVVESVSSNNTLTIVMIVLVSILIVIIIVALAVYIMKKIKSKKN